RRETLALTAESTRHRRLLFEAGLILAHRELDGTSPPCERLGPVRLGMNVAKRRLNRAPFGEARPGAPPGGARRALPAAPFASLDDFNRNEAGDVRLDAEV